MARAAGGGVARRFLVRDIPGAMAPGPWTRGLPAPLVRPWLVAAIAAAADDDVAAAVGVAIVGVAAANPLRNLTQVSPAPCPRNVYVQRRAPRGPWPRVKL